jgi:integrase
MSKRTERPRGARGGDPALYGNNIERRRENDEWGFKFFLRGKPHRGPCYTKDKAKAEKFAQKIKDEKKVEARQDRAAGLGPMTFGRACTLWWDDVGINNKETGLEFRLNRLRELIGEDRILKDITPDVITRAKNERAKDVRTAGKDDDGKQLHREITASAVKATLVTLRSVINHAATAHGVAVQMFNWKTWIKKDNEEFDVRIITPTEEEKIWSKLAEMDEDVAEFATFNLHHPKRVNELLTHRGRDGLMWANTDTKGGLIRIRLKGRGKLKDDPIDGDALDCLKLLKARKLHADAVFTYQSRRTRAYNGENHVKGERRPMTYGHFHKVWTAACEAVRITDINPHCIRHTGATRAYWDTKDINYVSELLNHADIRTTKRYYLKTDPEVIRDTMRTISENRKKKVSAKVSAKNLKLVG